MQAHQLPCDNNHKNNWLAAVSLSVRVTAYAPKDKKGWFLVFLLYPFITHRPQCTWIINPRTTMHIHINHMLTHLMKTVWQEEITSCLQTMTLLKSGKPSALWLSRTASTVSCWSPLGSHSAESMTGALVSGLILIVGFESWLHGFSLKGRKKKAKNTKKKIFKKCLFSLISQTSS